MRRIILFALLAVLAGSASPARAMLPATPGTSDTLLTLPISQPGLVARLDVAPLRLALPRSSPAAGHGEGLVWSGFAIGVLLALTWALAPYVGFYLSIPLGLIGLGLSIWGLVRARRWTRNRRTVLFGVLGIVLNAGAIAGVLVVMSLLFGA